MKKVIPYKRIKIASINNPTISVIIRCKNEVEHIDECLTKILSQNIKCTFEIIIIDSESSDGTIDKCLDYDLSIYQIKQDDFGFGSSINLGIQLARGELCVFVSAHAIPKDNNWLSELINPMIFDDMIAGSYSKQIYYDDTFFIEKRSLSETFKDEYKIQTIDKNIKVNRKILSKIVFSNASSCIRKDVAEKICFKDIIASEDRAWAFNVMEHGYKIAYNPKSQIYHAHNENIRAYYKRIYINSIAIYELWGIKLEWFHLIPLYMLQVYKDISYCNKNHIHLSADLIKESLIYRFFYVKAHFMVTRNGG